MNLEELANQKYQTLTANDREMLAAIFRDRQTIKNMNSTQLAAYLHVSRTTLVRLMKKFDIDSYTEFKLLLDRDGEDGGPCFYDLQDIVREYHFMIDELQKHDYEGVCRLIDQAGTIYLYGSGNEQKTIAEEFKRIFLTFGKSCVDLFDLGEVQFARARFCPEDLFLAISLSGESREAAEVVRTARESGIRTLSLTRWANNTLARMCQENLYVGTKTISQSRGESYEMVASFYILLDILSVRYLEYVQSQERGRTDEDR